MSACCEHYGSSQVQATDARQPECYNWCTLNDNSFADVPVSGNGTMADRNRAFRECLWTGVNGNEEFLVGPVALQCRYNDLRNVSSNATVVQGNVNATNTANATTATGQNAGTVLRLGGSASYFLAGLLVVSVVLA